MHSPCRVFGIGCDIHDDLTKTSANSTLFDRSAKTVKTIPVCKLYLVIILQCLIYEIHTILSRKQVVPVSNISAILILAAA